MKFNKQHRPYLVGAQFIGAPPIYRPGERIDGPLADKEFFQSKRGITPIGTRASPAFCRDKGRMRRWVGVWCLSSCMAIPPGVPADPLEQLTLRRTSTRPNTFQIGGKRRQGKIISDILPLTSSNGRKAERILPVCTEYATWSKMTR